MADTSSTRELALRLASERNIMLSASDLSFLESCANFAQHNAGPQSDVSKQLPETDTAILAAISDTFTLEEIGESRTSSDNETLFSLSDTVMIGGRRRLRLQREARVALLNRIIGTNRYSKVLSTAVDIDVNEFEAISGDPIRCASAWLRSFLYGNHGRIDRAPVDELRAAISALCQIDGVKLEHKLPSIDQGRRQLELAEFLEPLRMLVGTRGGWDGTEMRDRFAGRAAELRALRSHVDALESESTSELLGRGFGRLLSSASQLVSGRAPGALMLEARGGMGKSTLIAKFILDHARNEAKPVPTIYFDFDRATLRPREPCQLLLESIRQLCIQFPRIADRFVELDRAVREAMLGMQIDLRQEPADWHALVSEFRRIVVDVLTFGEGPLLLVLDTMEVVQADPDAMRSLVEFVDQLGTPAFAELRIVVAGRAEVPELLQATELREKGRKLVLAPLSIADANEMVEQLGRDIVGPGWKRVWSARIAGVKASEPGRREPLTLRIAVELMRSEQEDLRDELSLAIEKMDPDVAGGFVGPLYQRRILEHVRDPEVRKLAWPGLILRRITLDMVRTMLAPLCGLDVSKIEQTFASLANEVWIVTQDGDGLRHQPDLRSRTLPMMRRHGERAGSSIFDDVNQAAIRYFASMQNESLFAKAEWIYHRLLAGESVEQIEKDWSDDVAPLLAGAAFDFEAGSDAFELLQARAARKSLSVSKITALSTRRALEHLARTSPRLGEFSEERLSPILARLRIDEAFNPQDSQTVSNVRFSLCVKTGRWRGLGEIETESFSWRKPACIAQDYLASRDPSWQGSTSGAEFEYSEVVPEDAAGDRHWIRALVGRLVFDRLQSSDVAEREDRLLACALLGLLDHQNLARVKANVVDSAILRLAAVFGRESLVPAMKCMLSPRLGRQRDKIPVYSADEIRILLDLREGGQLARELKSSDKRLFSRVVEAARGGLRLRIAQSDWSFAVSRFLQSLVATAEGDEYSAAAQGLREFAAVRSEDWLIPMAYAAARTTDGRVPRMALNIIQSHVEDGSGYLSRTWVSSTRLQPYDVLEVLRLADEACDLPQVAGCFLDKSTDPDSAMDLQHLLSCHMGWRRRIEPVLQSAVRN